MKITKQRLKEIIKEELGSDDAIIDAFLDAQVGEDVLSEDLGALPAMTNAELLAYILQVGYVAPAVAAGATATAMIVYANIKNLLGRRKADQKKAAQAARSKAHKEQKEAELVLLSEFLSEDEAFLAALEDLTSADEKGKRKAVRAFNKAVRSKMAELDSMIKTKPDDLLARVRQKAEAGEIEARVADEFEEKVTVVSDEEAMRKAAPARRRVRVRRKNLGESKMKLTKVKLRQIIKEELKNIMEVDRGAWVVERDGVSADERYLTHGFKWGPETRAEVHEFKQEAEGVLRYALESGKIDSGRVTDMAALDDGDDEVLRLKGDPSQKEIDRLAYGARTGRWRDR